MQSMLPLQGCSVSLANSLVKTYLSFLWSLPSPSNISYWWGFGSLLGITMMVQVSSGMILALYYVSGTGAWDSVVEMTREVYAGWMIRSIHSNTASFVFIILFLHFLRGMSQGSFYLKGPWMSGWTIMLLTMAAAFLGYVLPWGQMSFWGATVIINLLSVMPMGKTLVTWLWGGFYVSAFTCSFFFALHFILPFGVLGAAAIHLLLLHKTGSSSFSGSSNSHALKIKFSHLFSYKDMVFMMILWMMWLLLLAFPDWAADSVNFMKSDLSNSPLHIQPEWYFLHFYAILRSIPNKLGGLVAFGLAFMVLLVLSMVNSTQSVVNIEFFSLMNWSFISVNVILMWLGSQPVEEPFTSMGLLMTWFYFFSLIVILMTDIKMLLMFDAME